MAKKAAQSVTSLRATRRAGGRKPTRSSFEHNAVQADGSIADYDEGRASVSRWFTDGMKVTDTPESVAETILLAARAKKPKPRYTSGKGVGRIALLRRLVPAPAFDRSLRQHMRLP